MNDPPGRGWASMSGDMHSFIVRVWKEGVDRVGNAIIWRCSIDNVVSGQRRYLDDLTEIGPSIREQVEGQPPQLSAEDGGMAGQEAT